MDPDNVLHFEAVVLEDDPPGWPAVRIQRVVDGLRDAGLESEDLAGPAALTEHVGGDEVPFSGMTGRHALTLDADGGWWWHTPGATLMQGRHTNRPEAVDEVIAAVQAVLEAAPPYFGRTWYATQMSPYWIRKDAPFAARDAGALTFFSRRYLRLHCGGQPLPNPPARSLEVAGGQLLVADYAAFGEATVAGLTDLDDWLHDIQPA